MTTRTAKIWDRELTFEVEVRESPVFTFRCPRCRQVVYRGAVGFDLEEPWECPECQFYEELWMFPHTLDGALFTVGGHYTNDPMTELPIEDVLKMFLWCESQESILVHGAKPHVLGTFEECVEALREFGFDV